MALAFTTSSKKATEISAMHCQGFCLIRAFLFFSVTCVVWLYKIRYLNVYSNTVFSQQPCIVIGRWAFVNVYNMR